MNRRHFLQLGGGLLVSGAVAARVGRGDGGAIIDPSHVDRSEELSAQQFHASRRYATTRFGAIAYVERGIGPAALFLHGFPLNGFQWRGALPRLAPYRRCIAPDFLGMGFTQVAPGQDVGPEAQVAMLIALLDTLAIDTVDLVANDSGGAIAQLLLARHPQRVRTILLSNCDSEIDSPPPALRPVIELSKQGRFVDEWLAPWWENPAVARSAQGIGGMCYADPSQPGDEAIDMYFGPLLATARRKSLAHAYAIGLERNALAGTGAALARSRAPARIVWGAADTIFAADGARHLQRSFGVSRGLRMIEGGKLFWPEERPDIIAEEARRLWNAWGPRYADWR
ncbi:MAG: alpha/beta fold hydrolase [Lysobacter sp.]